MSETIASADRDLLDTLRQSIRDSGESDEVRLFSPFAGLLADALERRIDGRTNSASPTELTELLDALEVNCVHHGMQKANYLPENRQSVEALFGERQREIGRLREINHNLVESNRLVLTESAGLYAKLAERDIQIELLQGRLAEEVAVGSSKTLKIERLQSQQLTGREATNLVSLISNWRGQHGPPVTWMEVEEAKLRAISSRSTAKGEAE